MCGRGGDGGDGVAFVEHFVACQTIAAQVREVDGSLAQFGDFVAGVGEVRRRDDGLHAGQSGGLAGVDAAEVGMGMRAAQDAAVQQAGHLHVGAEDGPAGDLVHAVVTDGTGADDLEVACLAHDGFPCQRSEVRSQEEHEPQAAERLTSDL